MDAEGGGATGRGRSLFHQTATTGNTDQTHLLVCDAVGPVVCEGSPEKNKQKKKQSATRIDSKGTKRECVS